MGEIPFELVLASPREERDREDVVEDLVAAPAVASYTPKLSLWMVLPGCRVRVWPLIL